MQTQQTFEQLLPVDNLQRRLKSNKWQIRKQAYEQILYLLQQNNGRQNKGIQGKKLFQIGGRQYTVQKLVPFFQDIVNQEHPGVLVAALQCVQVMIQNKMCTGRQFLKLTGLGFDKFPLKINKGKQIMQQFANIIQKIDLQPQFLLNKLSNSPHQKCTIFALQVVSMLGMTQLIGKVRQIAQKHPKSSVKQVALQIIGQLEELQNNNDQNQQGQDQFKLPKNRKDEFQPQNIQTQNLTKQNKQKPRKKTPTKSTPAQQFNTFTRNQSDILQKVSQYEQLNSKQQQKYSEDLFQLIQKYFKMSREGKGVPSLPFNQLGNFSYIVRIMIQSNNAIISTNGLKILKIMIENNSALIPRSFPLLFIFQKFKLHATHQINQLLYQLCDSLLLCNSISTIRNIDLIQAVSQGAFNKKANVKYGSFMVFLRTVALLYGNQTMFYQNFVYENQQQELNSKLSQILSKINEGDVEKIKQKLIKLLNKCLQNFSAKMSDEKKYQQKLQDIRIAMSLAYGSSTSATQTAVNSTENLKNKTLTKNLSQVTSKIQTNNPRINKISSQNKNQPISQDYQKTRSTNSIRAQGSYKILNPQQKSNKILSLCTNPTPGSISSIKKLVLESLVEFEQCIDEQRFQLFYYGQVLQNFINNYQPHDKTCDIISQYLSQLLLKISQIKINTKITSNIKFLKQGLRNIMKICFCDVILGQNQLNSILYNLLKTVGINFIVQALILLNQSKKPSKIKKKNRKIVLQWLDQNIPTQCLSDELFQIMDKIQKGQSLGICKIDHEIRTQFNQIQKQSQIISDMKMQKRITFNQNADQDFQIYDPNINNQKNNNRETKKPNIKEKRFRQNKNFEDFEQQQRNDFNKPKDKDIQKIQKQQKKTQKFVNKQKMIPQPSPYLQQKKTTNKFQQHLNTLKSKQTTDQNSLQYSNLTSLDVQYSQLKPKQNIPKIAINPLDRSQISQIDYKQDHSILAVSGYQNSTQREIQINFTQNQKYITNNNIKQVENKIKINQFDDYGLGYGGVANQEQNMEIEQYYKQYKKPKFIQNLTKKHQYHDKSIQQQQDKINIEQYRQYIKKIRQDYLPSEYLNQDNHLNKSTYPSVNNNKQQIKSIQLPSKTQQSIKQQPPQQKSSHSSSQQDQQKQQTQFLYKILNTNKLTYMLQNTANPYSHLRNQVLLPFKKSQQKEYFVQQLSLFVTTLPSISHPQPYNSILLAVILLFSQIQANRNLITPLQQLYEHMASLVTTNQFLSIILSIFHSVIQQTSTQLRTFLITILSKSISRLMPHCQKPVDLLRDLGQFYNIGQNVYFQMYEEDYRQICAVLEGGSLRQVVERALIQQGQNLGIIVQSWFETKMKNKIKQYIKQIIEQNQQEGLNDQHRFEHQQEYQY